MFAIPVPLSGGKRAGAPQFRRCLKGGRGGCIGVLFGWFAYKIEGPGLDGVYSIYQGHLFFQKATYGWMAPMHLASLACRLLEGGRGGWGGWGGEGYFLFFGSRD